MRTHSDWTMPGLPQHPAFLLAAMLLTGCGGATDTAPTAPIAATITISPTPPTLQRGTVIRFSAQVRTASGATIGNASTTWSSTAPLVARVDGFGEVSALGAGNATIVVSSGSLVASVPVEVTDPDGGIVTSIALQSQVPDVWVGDSLALFLTPVNKWFDPIPGAAMNIVATDPTIAVVDANRVVRALRTGTTTLVATSGNVELRIPFTVTVPELLILEGPTTFVPGSDALARVVATEKGTGRRIPIPATWSSSDATVASASESGMVTAMQDGTTSIRAVTRFGTVQSVVNVNALAGAIAYEVGADGRVAVLTLDGSVSRNLPITAKFPAALALSPDGGRLAYECATGVCVWSAGAGVKQLDEPPSGSYQVLLMSPSWSADGTKLAVQNGNNQVDVFDNRFVRILSGVETGLLVRPRLSPDGNSIIYQCDLGNWNERPDDLCRAGLNLVISGEVLLRDVAEAALAPDGDHLALSYGGRLCITTINHVSCTGASGSSAACVSSLSAPSWSPDSKYIVGSRDGYLWIADPFAGSCIRLLRSGSAGTEPLNPTWAAGSPLR